MILFSSISPDYEKNLKDELFACFKYIGIPFNILDKMPIRDRKYYIMRHNEVIENEKKRANNSKEISGEMINKFTDMSQMKERNKKQ